MSKKRAPQTAPDQEYTVVNGRARVDDRRNNRSPSASSAPQQVWDAIVTSNRCQPLERTQSFPTIRPTSEAASTETGPPPDDVHTAPHRVERRERKKAESLPKQARRVITGRRKSGGGRFRGASEAGRDLFVYRVHTETVGADIEHLVAFPGHTVLGIECMSNPNAKYKSFKLTVPVSE